jgi:hypothetical protein
VKRTMRASAGLQRRGWPDRHKQLDFRSEYV